MRKWALVSIFLTGALLLGGVGCGPKMASPETLSQLEEAKGAIQKARDQKSKLEQEIPTLQATLKQMQDKISRLEQERDSLKAWLNLLEQGY